MSMKALLVTLIGVVVALGVAVIVLVVTLTGIEDRRAYEDCLARAGFPVDESITTLDELDALGAAAERCLD